MCIMLTEPLSHHADRGSFSASSLRFLLLSPGRFVFVCAAAISWIAAFDNLCHCGKVLLKSSGIRRFVLLIDIYFLFFLPSVHCCRSAAVRGRERRLLKSRTLMCLSSSVCVCVCVSSCNVTHTHYHKCTDAYYTITYIHTHVYVALMCARMPALTQVSTFLSIMLKS